LVILYFCKIILLGSSVCLTDKCLCMCVFVVYTCLCVCVVYICMCVYVCVYVCIYVCYICVCVCMCVVYMCICAYVYMCVVYMYMCVLCIYMFCVCVVYICVCVYVSVCVSTWGVYMFVICVSICVCLCVLYMCMCIYVCVCVWFICVYVCMCKCLCVVYICESVCMSVYVFMCVCLCVVYMFMCVYVCVLMLGCSSPFTFSPYFLRKNLILELKADTSGGCPASRCTSVTLPQCCGDTYLPLYTTFMWAPEFKLRPSCLHSKHFVCWAISQLPQILLHGTKLRFKICGSGIVLRLPI